LKIAALQGENPAQLLALGDAHEGGVGEPPYRFEFAASLLKEFTHGFSATTLPFFQTYTGVPCTRAVLRAALAARRSARPTASENSLLVCSLGFRFTAIFPITLRFYPSYHTRSKHPTKDDKTDRSSPSCA